MAQQNRASPWSIEAAVRQFAALPSPPLLILLSVRNWCSGDLQSDKTPWDIVEAESLRVCEKYGALCISQKRALLPLMLAGHLNRSDVVRTTGNDCLHVINAPLGVDLISLMLTNWFDDAMRRYARHHSGDWIPSGGSDRTGSQLVGSRALPNPLWKRNSRSSLTRCYAFTTSDGRWIRELGLRTRPIRWRTSWCPPKVVDRSTSNTTFANQGTEADCDAAVSSNYTKLHCPSHFDRHDIYASFMANPPRHFFFCHVALNSGTRKQSFGVAALVPGATLRFGDLANSGHRQLSASLTYLTSYAGGMGIGALHCEHCRCAPREVDAHTPARNESVYVTVRFNVRDADHPLCEVVLSVLSHSSSGGHKFKVRFATFSSEEEERLLPRSNSN